MLLLTQRTTQLRTQLISWLKLLSWTIQGKSKKDIHQSLIATLPILHANSTKLKAKLREELVRLLNLNQRPLNQVMLLWLDWSHKNQCVLKPLVNTPHLEDLLSEIWSKQLLLVLSRKLLRRITLLQRSPKVLWRKENEDKLLVYSFNIKFTLN